MKAGTAFVVHLDGYAMLPHNVSAYNTKECGSLSSAGHSASAARRLDMRVVNTAHSRSSVVNCRYREQSDIEEGRSMPPL